MTDSAHIHETEIDGRIWRITIGGGAEQATLRHRVIDAVDFSAGIGQSIGSDAPDTPSFVPLMEALADADIAEAARRKIVADGITGDEVTLTAEEIGKILGWGNNKDGNDRLD